MMNGLGRVSLMLEAKRPHNVYVLTCDEGKLHSWLRLQRLEECPKIIIADYIHICEKSGHVNFLKALRWTLLDLQCARL